MQKSTMIACAMALVLFVLSGFGRDVFAADKVTICHKDVKTASVAAQAVSAHQQQTSSKVSLRSHPERH
jgi:hypothetical protein